MKLSIRISDGEEVSIKDLNEAKSYPNKEAYLIVNNHDEKPYRACKKIKLSDVALVSQLDL